MGCLEVAPSPWCVLLSLNYLLTSLESKLRLFACLTKGDIIGIEYNDKVSFSRVVCVLMHLQWGICSPLMC